MHMYLAVPAHVTGCTCTCTWLYLHMYLAVPAQGPGCTYICSWLYLHMYLAVPIHVLGYIFTCTWLYMHMYLDVYWHVSGCTCLYLRVYLTVHAPIPCFTVHVWPCQQFRTTAVNYFITLVHWIVSRLYQEKWTCTECQVFMVYRRPSYKQPKLLWLYTFSDLFIPLTDLQTNTNQY